MNSHAKTSKYGAKIQTVKEMLYGLNHNADYYNEGEYGHTETSDSDCCEVMFQNLAETLTIRPHLCCILLQNDDTHEVRDFMWDVLTDERGYSMDEIKVDYKKLKIENEKLKLENEKLKLENEKLAKKGQKILEILNE